MSANGAIPRDDDLGMDDAEVLAMAVLHDQNRQVQAGIAAVTARFLVRTGRAPDTPVRGCDLARRTWIVAERNLVVPARASPRFPNAEAPP